IRCVYGKKIGPDPRNFNQRVSLGRNDLLIRTFPKVIEVKIMHDRYISAVFKMLSEVNFCNFNSFISDIFEDVSYASIGLDDYSVNVHFLRLRAADCKFCQLNGKYFCSLYNVKLLR
ncbi:hypothetical protein, partial [Escherichia coli]